MLSVLMQLKPSRLHTCILPLLFTSSSSLPPPPPIFSYNTSSTEGRDLKEEDEEVDEEEGRGEERSNWISMRSSSIDLQSLEEGRRR